MSKGNIFSLFCVALIWGITNSLIKKSCNKQFALHSKNKNISRFEILNWIMNPLYTISVAFNLLGSLLFFYQLSDSSIYML